MASNKLTKSLADILGNFKAPINEFKVKPMRDQSRKTVSPDSMEADQIIPLTNQKTTKETSSRIQFLACHKTHFSQHSSLSCPSSPTSYWANSTENENDDHANTDPLYNEVQCQVQGQKNNIHFFQLGTT